MYKREFRFQNGDEVKEKITGFSGIVTGTCFYLTGCNQYLVTCKPKDEFSEPKAIWYDEGRLELITASKFKQEDVSSDELGCDIPPLQGKRGF